MSETVEIVQMAAVGGSEVADAERKLVARMAKQVADARKADRVFRARVVRDRAVADGRALDGYEVSAQLVAAIIDTLIPFIYAKDPDVDVVPEDQTAPPYKPRAYPPKPPIPPAPGDLAGEAAFAQQAIEYQHEMQEFMNRQAADQAQAEMEREHNDFVRRLGQTIEIVVSRMWRVARLKAEAKAWVRAGLTTGEGWLKVSLQGDLLTDPTVQRELYELQQQQQAIQALSMQVDSGALPDTETEMALLQAKIEGAQARLETYVGRCLAIDWVDTLDMQTPHSLRKITDFVRSPWLADCTYMSKEDTAARFALDPARLASATCWRAPDETEGPMPYESVRQNPGDGEFWIKTATDDTRGMLRVWELHSRQDNMIYTWVDGCEFWARPPMPPRIETTRFYPYFLWAPYECDGSRHPQSLAGRLSKLQDEYAITRTNEAESKRRAKPGILVDATNFDDNELKKVTDSHNQEITPVKPLRPAEPLGNSFFPKAYARVDPALYDTTKIRSDMETISGANESLRQGATTPKTATQSEIENQGTSARTGYARDALDMELSELSEYTAELALGGFPRDQVQKWAGPHAVWPNTSDSEDIKSLVYVSIRAGSSGKPNTSAERQAWATILPMIQGLMMQIAQANGADPQEVADKLKELLRETVARTGDHLDIDRFLPMPSPMAQSGQMQPQVGGPMPEQGMQGEQAEPGEPFAGPTPAPPPMLS